MVVYSTCACYALEDRPREDEPERQYSLNRSYYLNPVKTQPGGSSRYVCLRSSAAVGRSSGFLCQSSQFS